MIIYGASGHGKVIAEILEERGITNITFIDDHPTDNTFLDYPLHKSINFEDLNDSEIIIAIGNNRIRKSLSEKLNCHFATAIHPSAQVSKRSFVGKGTVVMAGVSVNSEASIGNHVILNTNCSIDHDCLLEDFVHISPNAALAGNVKVGKCTHIGIGASVIQGVTIGRYVTIGAGAVVIRDIPDFSTAVGNPARIIKCKPNE